MPKMFEGDLSDSQKVTIYEEFLNKLYIAVNISMDEATVKKLLNNLTLLDRLKCKAMESCSEDLFKRYETSLISLAKVEG